MNIKTVLRVDELNPNTGITIPKQLVQQIVDKPPKPLYVVKTIREKRPNGTTVHLPVAVVNKLFFRGKSLWISITPLLNHEKDFTDDRFNITIIPDATGSKRGDGIVTQMTLRAFVLDMRVKHEEV